MEVDLHPRTTPDARVEATAAGWRLHLPAGPAGDYRLAQLDDYTHLPRRRFPWSPPVRLSVRARTSDASLPGTWGFGFWNDPFALALGVRGGNRRLPALPNSAWFFFASSHNYLSLRDDLPAEGALAATFRSPTLPPLLLAMGVPFIPLLAWPWTARFVRRLGRRMIGQAAAQLPRRDSAPGDTAWRQYRLTWVSDRVTFSLDEQHILETTVVPHDPLGLVLWVDNQYAALPPDGRLRVGTLANPEPLWVELADLRVVRPGRT